MWLVRDDPYAPRPVFGEHVLLAWATTLDEPPSWESREAKPEQKRVAPAE